MGNLSLRKYKRALQTHLKIFLPGERHKEFDYPAFVEIPAEWQVHPNTPIEVNEMRTAVCYAGDVRRNFISYYFLKKIDWERDFVICHGIEEQKDGSWTTNQTFTFYSDAVALIPLEIIPPRIRLALLHEDELFLKAREQKKRRQINLKDNDVSNKAGEVNNVSGGTRSSETSGPTQPTTGVEIQQPLGPGTEVVGEEKEAIPDVGSLTGNSGSPS